MSVSVTPPVHMQCHNEASRPLTQYARIGKFSYHAPQNGFALPPSLTATNRKYHFNDDQQQQHSRRTNNFNHFTTNNTTNPTSTTPSRLHQSCHDLRVSESLITAPRMTADEAPAFQRVEAPVTVAAAANNAATGNDNVALAPHRWSRQRSSDSCNIANCGKILWVSRETVGVPVDNDYEAARTFAASKGYYYDREQNVRIRTNAKGLPYTPLPERKQDFLANQRAIEAVVPLLFNRRRQSS